MARKAILIGAAGLAASAAFAILRTRRARRENPPLGRFVEVDGVRLHYVERGSGEPLVLLHGNGSMIQEFLASDLVRLAAQKYRVLIFDRPGYGWSTRPRDRQWTPAAQADLISAAVHKLGVGRARVYGHSWGTLVAVEWALRHPDQVSTLTLASGYYFPTRRLDVVLASGPAVPVLGDLARFTLVPVIGRLAWPLLKRGVFSPQRPTAAFEAAFPRGLALSPLSLRASAEEAAMMIPAASRLQNHYRNLKPPVSIVAGDGDRLVTTSRQSERLHAGLAGSHIRIFPGVGHMIHHIEPRGVVEVIENGAA